MICIKMCGKMRAKQCAMSADGVTFTHHPSPQLTAATHQQLVDRSPAGAAQQQQQQQQYKK
jgi:hypothetical protein